MAKLLDNIDSPEELKALPVGQLKQLCSEIREYMVDCCSRNPGHLGSSLGAVEIITALHYVYDTPKDKVVYDVSHQAYAHKILTGRREAFRNNRRKDGLSGFVRRDESPYDAFGAGHSSTSISAALGLAEAASLRGADEKVVALIGDGALTGGLAYEGLNNAGGRGSDLLVILNDNNISIDRNIGSVHEYLLKLTTDPRYNNLKDQLWERMGDSRFRKWVQDKVVGAKSTLVRNTGGSLFEEMGFRYFGPVDGNDIVQLVQSLQRLKGMRGPRLLHIITTKGKGYAPAEKNPTLWHAPGMFDPVTGERLKAPGASADRYQDVFGEVLLELARKDDRIVGVTPAMATGCGMNILAGEMPGRVFDVGIAEEHAVTFSAGLAAGGLKPFCNIYSSFAQRAYDQVIHDVALQHLPVVLCLDRSGLVGEDGATHHGCFDIASCRCIPGAVIAVPKDELELRNMMFTASLAESGPFIIRYPRGNGEGVAWRGQPFERVEPGTGECLLEGSDVAVIAAGPVAHRALKAALGCELHPSVYNIRYVKPVDEGLIGDAASCHSVIVTIEDGSVIGGLYSAVSEYVASKGLPVQVIPVGIPDRFVGQGSQSELQEECGYSEDRVFEELRRLMEILQKK